MQGNALGLSGPIAIICPPPDEGGKKNHWLDYISIIIEAIPVFIFFFKFFRIKIFLFIFLIFDYETILLLYGFCNLLKKNYDIS